MILSLTILLLALILVGVLWLIWVQPTGRELHVGLITIGSMAMFVLVTMVVLTPSAHW